MELEKRNKEERLGGAKDDETVDRGCKLNESQVGLLFIWDRPAGPHATCEFMAFPTMPNPRPQPPALLSQVVIKARVSLRPLPPWMSSSGT